MNIELFVDDKTIKIDPKKFQKMLFLYNSLDEGWSIKKKNDSYVLRKPHENKKEILNDSFLSIFMKEKLSLNTILL